jgi:hypothetical protein
VERGPVVGREQEQKQGVRVVVALRQQMEAKEAFPVSRIQERRWTAELGLLQFLL